MVKSNETKVLEAIEFLGTCEDYNTPAARGAIQTIGLLGPVVIVDRVMMKRAEKDYMKQRES